MITGKRLLELSLDATLSGVWAAIGPFFFKLAVFKREDKLYNWFQEHGFWMVYVFDIIMIVLLLSTNTVSVIYRMKSFKIIGAFTGWTLVFVFQWLFSVPLDYILDSKFPHWRQFLGAGMVLVGVLTICYEHETHKLQTIENNPSFNEKSDGYAYVPPDHSHPARLRGDMSPAKIWMATELYDRN